MNLGLCLRHPRRMRIALCFFALVCCAVSAVAQGNYEIQVYGSDTVAPKSTMVELHSNYTVNGQHNTVDGVYPTNHQLHETVEITQGLTSWSEVGFRMAMECSGWAITSDRGCGYPIRGTGRWE
jgi:hypothetical protein